MKVGDTVHFNVDYLGHLPFRPGVVLRINGGMATVRMPNAATITVRVSILEVIR